MAIITKEERLTYTIVDNIKSKIEYQGHPQNIAIMLRAKLPIGYSIEQLPWDGGRRRTDVMFYLPQLPESTDMALIMMLGFRKKYDETRWKIKKSFEQIPVGRRRLYILEPSILMPHQQEPIITPPKAIRADKPIIHPEYTIAPFGKTRINLFELGMYV